MPFRMAYLWIVQLVSCFCYLLHTLTHTMPHRNSQLLSFLRSLRFPLPLVSINFLFVHILVCLVRTAFLYVFLKLHNQSNLTFYLPCFEASSEEECTTIITQLIFGIFVHIGFVWNRYSNYCHMVVNKALISWKKLFLLVSQS